MGGVFTDDQMVFRGNESTEYVGENQRKPIANLLLMRGDHKNIAEPKVGSGKFYKNTTKILNPWRKMKTGPLYEISHTQPLINVALLLEVEMVEW